MLLPFFLGLTLGQASLQSAQAAVAPGSTAAAPVAVNFTVAPPVAEIRRLEMTPKIDGRIDDEEWDPFSGFGPEKTYLQWEPGIIYAAASGAEGQDLLISLDLHGDGWLVGDDNLEARVTNVNGKATVSVRRLDAGNKSGPVWQDLPAFALASQAASSSDGSTVTYELALVDPGYDLIPDKPTKIDARIDLIPTSDAPRDPFLPRALTEVQLGSSRAAALPPGIRWGVERNYGTVPGDKLSIRLTYNAKPPIPIRKIDLRSEGSAKDATNQVSIPFPGWDNKGRSFVDYNTRIEPGTDIGYHVLHETVTAADGTPAVVEISYRVAPTVDFDVVQRMLPPDIHDRSVTVGYYLNSNADRVVKGDVSISVPPTMRIVNGGDDRKFVIGDRKGRIRGSLQLFIPGNSAGSFPLVFKVTANGETTSYIRVLNIQ